MRLSILTDSINAVVGSDRVSLITQYFLTGSPEITLVVHNEVKDVYYVFYEESDIIQHYIIGTGAIAFKNFIYEAYGFQRGMNYSQSFLSNLAPEVHIKAKNKLMAAVAARKAQFN